jgi:hypothetical protein
MPQQIAFCAFDYAVEEQGVSRHDLAMCPPLGQPLLGELV